jgi:hypothetical protein
VCHFKKKHKLIFHDFMFYVDNGNSVTLLTPDIEMTFAVGLRNDGTGKAQIVWYEYITTPAAFFKHKL